jgi:hypothetical protein
MQVVGGPSQGEFSGILLCIGRDVRDEPGDVRSADGIVRKQRRPGEFSKQEPQKTSLDNLDSRDGELRASSRQMWAVYRPDLSYKPENRKLAKTRYVDVATFRVKLGKDDDFAGGAKAIFGAYEKSNLDMCILGYQVVAGAQSGTFLLFAMMIR